METPIYKLWKAAFQEAAFELTQEAWDSMNQKKHETEAAIGMKTIVTCDCQWSNERWTWFGVELFPNTQALIQHAKTEAELAWLRYLQGDTLLGTSTMEVKMPENSNSGVYKLVFGRSTAAGYRLEEEAWAPMVEKLNQSMKDNAVTRVVDGMLLTSERWQFFALEHYPSMEEVIAHRRCMNEIGWFQYIEAYVLLGT